jgi:hypothetical protein
MAGGLKGCLCQSSGPGWWLYVEAVVLNHYTTIVTWGMTVASMVLGGGLELRMQRVLRPG